MGQEQQSVRSHITTIEFISSYSSFSIIYLKKHNSFPQIAGSNGMGQAQSQSSGGDCADCFGAFGMLANYFLSVSILKHPMELTCFSFRRQR